MQNMFPSYKNHRDYNLKKHLQRKYKKQTQARAVSHEKIACALLSFPLLPSHQSIKLLNLPTLVNRRTMLGTIFMQTLIRGDIYAVELVNRLTFNVPVRLTRNYYPLNLSALALSRSM